MKKLAANQYVSILMLGLSALLLASCGGGGDDGGGGLSALPMIPEGELFIKGSVTVSSSVDVDSDVRDPKAAFEYNDLVPEEAQLVPNPSTINGNVDCQVAVCGWFPSYSISQDPLDVYRVSLQQGQKVTVSIADHQENDPFAVDADIFLLDLEVTEFLDCSTGTLAVETVTAPYTGEFFVAITPFAGSSNYILAIGQGEVFGPGPVPCAAQDPSNFVAGEAIVIPAVATAAAAEAESASANPADRVAAFMARNGLRKKRSNRRGHMLLQMDAVDGLPQVAEKDLSIGQKNGIEKLRKLTNTQGYATFSQIKALNHDPEVRLAEPNYIYQAQVEPSDEYYPLQWHYPLINLPAAWDLTTGSIGVKVAVIDTGILASHPDLEGQISADGYDFISDLANANDGNGVDSNPEDPGDGGFGIPSSFHGTHVAGTIAAKTNFPPSTGEGVAGVAPDIRIMPIRVLGQFGGSTFDIAEGIRYAAGLETATTQGAPVPADIINLSLGGPFPSATLESAVLDARAAGVIIVAAAGNGGSSAPGYPAQIDGVIAVSAVGPDRTLAPYSSFGNLTTSTIDLAAPGGDLSINLDGDPYPDGVLSTGADDSGLTTDFGYLFLNGTSMAAPHVAGVLALMKSVNGTLTPDLIDNLIASGALSDDLGDTGLDGFYGHGLINAQKAVAAALDAIGNPPVPQPSLGVTPRSLNYGITLGSITLNLRNNAGGDLNIVSISTDAPWLTAPAPGPLGDYAITVDRAALQSGTYVATVTVVSDVNTVEVPVVMQVSNEPIGGDAGYLYIRLIDPATGEIRQVSTAVEDSRYDFRFNNVPAGEYQIVVFSDVDNDDKVCDAGEACASYPTGQPFIIELQDNLTGVEFPVSYSFSPDSE